MKHFLYYNILGSTFFTITSVINSSLCIKKKMHLKYCRSCSVLLEVFWSPCKRRSGNKFVWLNSHKALCVGITPQYTSHIDWFYISKKDKKRQLHGEMDQWCGGQFHHGVSDVLLFEIFVFAERLHVYKKKIFYLLSWSPAPQNAWKWTYVYTRNS